MDRVLATFFSRALAFIIDELLLSFLFMFVLYDQISNTSTTEELISLVNSYSFIYLIVKIVYQTIFIHFYQASLGKIFLKIKVVNQEDDQKISLLTSLNRSIFRAIGESIFYIGFIFSFFNKDRQALHDKIAKTLVVNA